MQVVAVDIGGTHARFALAEVAQGRVVRIDQAVTLRTTEHADLPAAWQAFAGIAGHPLPRAAALGFAGPTGDAVLTLTNSHWIIRRALIAEQLGVDRFTLVNDFEAVGHAVAQAPASAFRHICGPDVALPRKGIVTVVGPGTGLGVAQLVRDANACHVVATEGGHMGFAPVDAFEDELLGQLRRQTSRVSVERVAAGPGLRAIYTALAEDGRRPLADHDDKSLWTAALAGSDPRAVAALERFCMILGSVTGDLALAQGAIRADESAVVIAGGLGARLADHLPRSGFARRFVAKGRFAALMQAIPVKLIVMNEPGLFGAAAAFAREHAQ